jgi:predicted MPP superfamily phosphohydrolase
VYFADTQFGSTTKSHFNRVIETIIDQDPEFIAFGGDLVDIDDYQASDFEALNNLTVPLYFISGNHEYYHDVPRVLEYMKQYPQVRVLDDEKIDL